MVLRVLFFSFWTVGSTHTTFMILDLDLSRSGTGLPRYSADFCAISGRISCTISNLARVFFLFSSLLRWLFRFLAHSLRARLISLEISSKSATASFPSEVKGTLVDAMWTSIIAGPNGIPFPPLCSSPYLLQSMLDTALVMAQAPGW